MIPVDWLIHWWMTLIDCWMIPTDWFGAEWLPIDWLIDWFDVEWSRFIDSLMNDSHWIILIICWMIQIDWIGFEWYRWLTDSLMNDPDWLADSLLNDTGWLTDRWWMIPIDWLIHCWHITSRSHIFNKPQIRSQTLLRYVTSMLKENREIQNFADWTWKAKMN